MPYDPKKPAEEKAPILIYGVASAIGAFRTALDLGPIIGVAGRAGEFTNALADYVYYRRVKTHLL